MQMLKYLETEEIDRKKWDSCIKKSRAGLIYGLSWYLDLVAPGWKGIVEDDYRSVMPLPVRERFGIKYIFQPLFAQQLGVYSQGNVQENIIFSFLNAIPDNIKYIDTNFNFTNYPGSRLTGITKKINFELNLKKKYPHLKSDYSHNNKRNIQRSIPFIELVDNIPVADLIRLKRQNSVSKKPLAYYEWMHCFVHKLVTSGYGKIAGGKRTSGNIEPGSFKNIVSIIEYSIDTAPLLKECEKHPQSKNLQHPFIE